MSDTGALTFDSSNADQARAWDGGEGEYWAAHADYYDRAVARHHERLMGAAAIAAADRVLDIGCGTGQTTRDAARAAVAGEALGVDMSAAMLEVARQRAAAEGVDNARFEHADAQIHPFDAGSFDVVISRTGVMFFGDPVAAFANFARALRSGGRLAIVAWQARTANEWIRELSDAMAAGRRLPSPPDGAPGPFALADPERVRTVLTSAGFVAVELEALHEPIWLGRDADDGRRHATEMLGWMLDGLDAAGRDRALRALHATMAAHQTADGVLYGSAAWLVRARRP